MNNKIVNENLKNKSYFAKNFFWSGTFTVILLCALLFLIGGNDWNPIKIDGLHIWTDGLYLNRLFYGFLQSFGHSNLQHRILNMLCFLVVGLYLERKIGTLKLLLLVVAFAFLSTGITAANALSVTSIGYSGVNFAFYFYIIVDFLFMIFQSERRTASSVILGIVTVALIYLAMCFNGGTSGFGFEWYPYDLFRNMGHMGGAIAGTIVGLIVQITKSGGRGKAV